MEQETQVLVRNVLIVGKTGSGKSTVANFFISHGGETFPVNHGVQSTNAYFCMHTEVEFHQVGVRYKSKIIDTRGLFDTGNETSMKILEEVDRYLEERVDEGINLLLFVMKKGKLTQEEEKVFDIVTKHFESDVSCISALVITHCESDDKEEREEFVKDFRAAKNTINIAAFMKKGILTVGFPNICGKIEKEKKFHESIEKDEKALRNLLIGCADMTLDKKNMKDLISRSREVCIIL